MIESGSITHDIPPRFVRARLPIEPPQILGGGIALRQESLAMVFDEADRGKRSAKNRGGVTRRCGSDREAPQHNNPATRVFHRKAASLPAGQMESSPPSPHHS